MSPPSVVRDAAAAKFENWGSGGAICGIGKIVQAVMPDNISLTANISRIPLSFSEAEFLPNQIRVPRALLLCRSNEFSVQCGSPQWSGFDVL